MNRKKTRLQKARYLFLPIALVAMLSGGALAADAKIEGPGSTPEVTQPDKTVMATVEGNAIYANGLSLVIMADGDGTTVYVDANRDGVVDGEEKSLFDLGVADAPENGADLSGHTVFGGKPGEAAAENVTIMLHSGVVGAIYGGGTAEEPKPEEPKPEEPKPEEPKPEEPKPEEPKPEEPEQEEPQAEYFEMTYFEAEPAPELFQICVLEVRGGAVYVDFSRAAAGTELTMVLTPEDGNTLDTLLVTDSNGAALELTEQADGSYRFIMPEGNIELTVIYCK